MAGLTTTGIEIKDVDEIIADMVSDQVANIDAKINTEADSILGQLNGIYGAALAELWELVEEVYQSAYPDTASGQSLSYVSALTGAIRQEATKAELDVVFWGTALTTIPTGTQFYPDGDPDSLFQTTATIVIPDLGSPDFIAGVGQAVTAGSATTAAGGDDLVIATPVAGLNIITVLGSEPLNPGVDEETDADLRFRREQSLAQAGSSTVAAIRADMLDVAGVDTCTVFENPTGDTDDNGVPPYAIEVLVYNEEAPSYTTATISEQIFASKPAGTEAYGQLGPYTVTDTQGNDHFIKYSEPDTVQAYVEVRLSAATDGTYLGDDAVADAIADWASAELQVGQSVYASDIISVTAALEGVVSVNPLQTSVDDETPTVGINLELNDRELATIASGDVTVTAV